MYSSCVNFLGETHKVTKLEIIRHVLNDGIEIMGLIKGLERNSSIDR